MGSELDAAHYDKGYRTNPMYQLDADHAPWSMLWYWVIGRASGDETIADFGCGSGHLAELLHRRGHPPHRYMGVDFSEVALRQARERAPGYRFVKGTLPGAVKKIATLDATAVFCEVLEHITKDLGALKMLRSGTRVLATVPSKDSRGHVRHFVTMNSVCKRYETVLHLRSVERIGGAYAFEGRRK
ncbi:MAG TPA: class I SAM-dependent methyltransferase [Myxococcota bacterium]